MEELLKKMEERWEEAYTVFRDAELMGEAEDVAYLSGVLDGINKMMMLVKQQIE